MPSNYFVSDSVHILCHYPAAATWFSDHAAPHDPELDAAARSGDYFIALATRLENAAAGLPETSTATSSLILSKLAQELEYMQRHYEIIRRRTAGSDHTSAD